MYQMTDNLKTTEAECKRVRLSQIPVKSLVMFYQVSLALNIQYIITWRHV